MTKRIKKNSGFTLIEMLTVLFIVAIIWGVLWADFRTGGRNSDLRNAAEELVAILRQTQGSSLSGTVISSGPVSDLRLSLDTASNTEYKVCAGSEMCASNILETIELPAEVYIADIMLEGEPSVFTSKAQIIFVPPYGDIQFKGDSFSAEQSKVLAVNLQNFAGGSLWIKINPISGRITYEYEE
jgi:prepilin-type N-terminal cleavage/methylation domain-containing protein